MIFQIYIITVIFSMGIIIYMRYLAKTSPDYIDKMIMIRGNKTVNTTSAKVNNNYSWFVVFLPLVNLILAILFLWIIFATKEDMEKILNYLNEED